MNSLKTMVVLAVLGAVAYGVYVSLHAKKTTSDPRAANVAAVSTPKVELPNLNGSPMTAPKVAGSDASRFSAPPTRLTTETGSAPPDASNPFNSAARDGIAATREAPANGSTTNPAMSGTNNLPSPSALTGIGTSTSRPAAFNSSAADISRGANPANLSAFQTVWKASQEQLAQKKLAEAHFTLSMLYDDPSLSSAESRQLRDTLDQLAGTVIYSTQHLLEPAYIVQPGDRLANIADRYEIPAELLAKINGIENPNSLQPGESLKVIRGPFNAIINQERRELTLMVGGRYAGRFEIGIGRDVALTEANYQVVEKRLRPTYYGPNRQQIGPSDPSNPLGERWIGLGGMAGLHGTNDPHNIGRNDLRGCISLSPKDVDDVYDILSDRSKVTIRR